MNKQSFFSRIPSSLKWVFFISRRFSKVDRTGRSAVTSRLASLGVCFGVMTLIVTISVMNGFQMGFIDAIMEISSYHVRVTGVEEADDSFENWCGTQKRVASVTPFYEAQGLMVGNVSRQAAALVRAVPPDIMERDAGFAKQCEVISGSFDLSGHYGIILGSELARKLGVRIGDKISILALSGSSDVSLLSQNRIFIVRGIFHSGYVDINSAYAFITLADGAQFFGSSAKRIYGIKTTDSNNERAVIASIAHSFPGAQCESWRSYNRTFFGALRVEKNMLMLLVLLIFVVVAVNIYNGMRRMVYERREEIAVISALGGTTSQVQSVFVMQGFLTGIKGAVPGLVMGLFVCVRMESVFMLLSKAEYWIQYLGAMIVSPQTASALSENPMFMVYASIPARMVPSEIVLITLFGIFSSLVASWVASRGILKLTVAEVLRDD